LKLNPTDHLIEISDRCVRIAHHGRGLVEELNAAIGAEPKEPYSRLAKSARELTDELETLGHDLLRTVVALDTERDKNSSGTPGA
jgi:hypothetical protein